MGKAASHKVGFLTLALFVAIVVLFATVTRAVAYSPDPNEVPVGDQDVNDGVIGFITIDGDHAKATVENIGDSTESGGFASYLKTAGDTDDQVYYKSVTFTLQPHSKQDLSVELPCWAQVDLFKGDVLMSFANGARYGSRLVAAVHTKDECSQPSSTPMVTSSPTVTPTATPEETPGVGGGNPTPTPTNTPAPTATPTSTPAPTDTPSSSTPAPSSNGEVLGATIPQGGLTLPSTGGADYGYLAFAGYVLGFGIALRKYAAILDAQK